MRTTVIVLFVVHMVATMPGAYVKNPPKGRAVFKHPPQERAVLINPVQRD